MKDIKKMEIPKELYSEALEIIKGYKLEADFTSKYFFDTSDILREYQRRERNTIKRLKQLREQDKNIYIILLLQKEIL